MILISVFHCNSSDTSSTSNPKVYYASYYKTIISTGFSSILRVGRKRTLKVQMPGMLLHNLIRSQRHRRLWSAAVQQPIINLLPHSQGFVLFYNNRTWHETLTSTNWPEKLGREKRKGLKYSTHLCKKQIELLPWSMVSTLGEEDFNLFLDLFLIQMPAVFIIYASTCCWVRSTCKQQEKKLRSTWRWKVYGSKGEQYWRGLWICALSCFGCLGFNLSILFKTDLNFFSVVFCT